MDKFLQVSKIDDRTKLVKRISSRQVAEMMEVEHSKLLRKIDGFNTVFTKAKIGFSKYWVESSYKDGSGKSNKEYEVSKIGCEFLANKTTGEKGVLFTDRYMTAFEEMKDYIEERQAKPLTAIEQLQLQTKAILEVSDRMDKYENETPLFKAECDELQYLVKKKGVHVLGGKDSGAYKDNSLRQKVYKDIQNQLKREFGVNKYSWIKRLQFERAKEIVNNYTLPIFLEEQISEFKNQLTLGF